jgi:membrane associated rhomboid family serine protease
MGIYDRDYMDGSEDSRYGSAGARRFNALSVMIIINIAVWMLWQFSHTNPALANFLRDHFTVSPDGVFNHFRFHTLLTANISHESLSHIFFNLLFLYFLGQEVELRYGRRNFYVIYGFTAFMTGIGCVGVDMLKSSMFQLSAVPTLGASGCVMGVGVIAAFLDPNRLLYIFGLIPIKLKWLISFYILFDLLRMVGPEDGIAHSGHLSGALGGLLFYHFDLRVFGSAGRSHVGILYRIKNWFRRKPDLRIVEKRKRASATQADDFEKSLVASVQRKRAASDEKDIDSRPSTSNLKIDPQTAERVDGLLDKIHRAGLHSLTEEERDFLKNSSQKYKKT